MHELSITEGILDYSLKEAKKVQATKIRGHSFASWPFFRDRSRVYPNVYGAFSRRDDCPGG